MPKVRSAMPGFIHFFSCRMSVASRVALVLILAGIALWCGFTVQITHSKTVDSSNTVTNPLPALRGTDAVEHLKQQGLHNSLADVMAAALCDAQATVIDNRETIYQQAIDTPLDQKAKLIADDGAAGDRFGSSIAISGNTAVISAPSDDLVAVDQGSVYVFVRSGSTWTLQQKLTANDGATGDSFGHSVAISGDTIVAGAYLDDIGANPDQGSVYVFVRNGSTWSQQQKLMADDGAAGDFFGFSVAISDNTIVAGAYQDDIGVRLNQGSAYVFARSGASWAQQQKLTADDGLNGDGFGYSIAISGNSVVIGTFLDTIGANFAQGSAYIFARSGPTWIQQQRLTADDGAATDRFGRSVAISGNTVVVGASFGDIGGNAEQGAAYIYVHSGSTWSQQQKLTANDGAANDFFSFSVTISGDTVVVGSVVDDIGGNIDQGSVYVFARNGSTWNQKQKLTADDGAANDFFGGRVAIYEDLIVVGAYQDSIGVNTNQGSAYVFAASVCPMITLIPATLPNGVAGSNYNQNIMASGGAGPYQFSLSSGSLPPGLTLSQAGLISGSPMTAGAYNFEITATDAKGCSGSQSYTLVVNFNCQPITINPVSLAGGVQGAVFNQSLTATGGTTPYSFAVTSGALPSGLTLSSNGALSGTPTAIGSFNFTARAIDANNCAGTRDYSLTISSPAPVYEADVSTRPNGDGQVTMSDWTQVGRFAAGLDIPAEGGEFQRADCAPRDSLGNGNVTVADWVQAGRYAAGLDPLTVAGGPTKPAVAAAFEAADFTDAIAARGLRISAATFQRGQVNALQVEMEAQGNENAVSFTLNYDPSLLSFVEAAPGQELSEAQLLVNQSRAANGQVGVLFILPAGKTMRAGTVQALTLRFVTQGGANNVITKIGFGDQVVRHEVVDAMANALTGTAFSDGAALITGRAVASVSAADYIGPALAAESIAAAFGAELAAVEVAQTLPLPTALAGTTVKVRDGKDVERLAPLFFVSPSQINYQIPAGTADGIATVTITNANGVVSSGLIQVEPTRAALFTADASGRGLAAAYVVRVKPDGTQISEPVIRFDSVTNKFIAVPIDLSSEPDQVVLVLFGTGARNRKSLNSVKVVIGAVDCPVQYAGAQGGFVGLDQINAFLPRSLAGRGEVDVILTVDGRMANTVKIHTK